MNMSYKTHGAATNTQNKHLAMEKVQEAHIRGGFILLFLHLSIKHLTSLNMTRSKLTEYERQHEDFFFFFFFFLLKQMRLHPSVPSTSSAH